MYGRKLAAIPFGNCAGEIAGCQVFVGNEHTQDAGVTDVEQFHIIDGVQLKQACGQVFGAFFGRSGVILSEVRISADRDVAIRGEGIEEHLIGVGDIREEFRDVQIFRQAYMQDLGEGVGKEVFKPKVPNGDVRRLVTDENLMTSRIVFDYDDIVLVSGLRGKNLEGQVFGKKFDGTFEGQCSQRRRHEDFQDALVRKFREVDIPAADLQEERHRVSVAIGRKGFTDGQVRNAAYFVIERAGSVVQDLNSAAGFSGCIFDMFDDFLNIYTLGFTRIQSDYLRSGKIW